MSQIMGDPQLMSQMINSPMTQGIMQSMLANPSTAESLLRNNPLYANDPAMQQHLSAMMPQLLNQIQNPATQAAFSNPETLSALSQIQSGMETLRTSAPGLFNAMNVGNVPTPPTTSTNDSTTSASTTTTSTTPSSD